MIRRNITYHPHQPEIEQNNINKHYKNIYNDR